MERVPPSEREGAAAPPSSTPMSLALPRRALPVAGLLLAACGPEPATGWFEVDAVELTARGEWPDTAPSVVEDLPIRADAVAAWRSNGVTPTFIAAADPAAADTAAADTAAADTAAADTPGAVSIPRSTRPLALTLPRASEGPYDTVEVTVSTEGFLRLFAADGRIEADATRSEYLERQAPLAPEVLEFSLPTAGTADEVTLFINSMTHETRVHRVRLLLRPAAATVPSPFEPPRPVPVGDRSRPAVGLLPGVTLAGPALPVEGSRFEVHAAAPSGGPAQVELSLHAGGEALASVTSPVGPGWGRVELPAPAGAEGRECELRVTAPSGGPLLVSAPLHRGLPRRPERPGTVVLITSDTHRADHVGFAGRDRGALTPTLNALAARGTVFEDAISSTSITNPSHASIFTGLSVRDTGVTGNVVLLSEEAVTVAEVFQEAGYRTVAAVSARHLTPWRSGLGQGFDVFDAPSEGMTRDGRGTVDAARALLADVAPDEDLFLWLHLFDVHAPYRERPGITEQYYTGDPFAEELARIDPRAVARWNRRVRDAEYILALYKGEVTYLDGLLGDLLREEPRLDRGLLAFTSDHGEALGEIGLYWNHKGLYPSTLRVPLLLVGPGVPEGRRVGSPVENRSLATTLHGLALGAEGAPFAGRSLLDDEVLEGLLEEPRFVLGPNALSAGAFAGRWYLLFHLEQKGWGNPPGLPAHSCELYDLAADPDALVDVGAAHPDELRRLRAGLVRWLASADPADSLAGGAPTGAAVTADVAALGYATDRSSTIDGRLVDPDCACPRCDPFR